MKMFKNLALLVLVCLTFAGCAPKLGGSDYGVSGAQAGYRIEYGVVQTVRTVAINNDESSSGGALSTLGGAAVGGVLGNMVGGGDGRTLATIGGALAGAALGNVGHSALTNQQGVEVVVMLDNGSTMAVVQGADMIFRPGQRVRVQIGQGTTRVIPDNS